MRARTTTGNSSRASPTRTVATRTVTLRPAGSAESAPEPMQTGYDERNPVPVKTVLVESKPASKPASMTTQHIESKPAPKTRHVESKPAPKARHAGTKSAPMEAAPSKSSPPKPGRTHHAASETSSKTTTDHGAIRKWAERRGGHPTSVTGTQHGKETAGVLRLDFGVKDEKLQSVDWDSFFDKFEEAKLAFLYQDRTSTGKMSRFHKFIHRH